MTKQELVTYIIDQLSRDLAVQFNGALAAHEASTHEENIPDNKYETLALEASYLAQGQANRAREIRLAIDAYKHLHLREFNDGTPLGLTALVTLEAEDAAPRLIFIGPLEGGMKIPLPDGAGEITVITPASPLGRELFGSTVGDPVKIEAGGDTKEFEIVAVC